MVRQNKSNICARADSMDLLDTLDKGWTTTWVWKPNRAFICVLVVQISHLKQTIESLFFRLAWVEKTNEEENEEVESFDTVWDIFLNYTETSTIQGLIYIFFPYQVINSSVCIKDLGKTLVKKQDNKF